MSGIQKPIVLTAPQSFQQKPQLAPHTPVAANEEGGQANVPRTKGQGAHQILFNSPGGQGQGQQGQQQGARQNNPPPPSHQVVNTPSIDDDEEDFIDDNQQQQQQKTTPLGTGSRKRKNTVDDEMGEGGGSEQAQQKSVPPGAPTKSKRKTASGGGADASSSSSSTTTASRSRKRSQGNGGASKTTKGDSTSREMEKIAQEIARDFKFKNFAGRADSRGIMWMERMPDDDAPKKLSQIPTDAKHNEVEFTRWQEFKGKTSIGYLLYTVRGVKYWADACAIRWLQSARADGLLPGSCTFIVRNDKNKGLIYGFRKLETMDIESDHDEIEEDDDDDDNVDNRRNGGGSSSSGAMAMAAAAGGKSLKYIK